MMRHLKITALALTLAGFAAMTGAYQLGFELWPPRAMLANGTSAPFRPAEVQACFKARALAWAGDRGSDAVRQACPQQLITYQALGAFDLRTMAVKGSALIGLMALLGFAVAIGAGPLLRRKSPPMSSRDADRTRQEPQPERAESPQSARQQDDAEHPHHLPDPHADRHGAGGGLARSVGRPLFDPRRAVQSDRLPAADPATGPRLSQPQMLNSSASGALRDDVS
jgi:hypothetical protein